jgi:hypothetical protein
MLSKVSAPLPVAENSAIVAADAAVLVPEFHVGLIALEEVESHAIAPPKVDPL